MYACVLSSKILYSMYIMCVDEGAVDVCMCVVFKDIVLNVYNVC